MASIYQPDKSSLIDPDYCSERGDAQNEQQKLGTQCSNSANNTQGYLWS